MAAWLTLAGPAYANPASDALRARAADALYNLDDEHALTIWRQAVEADPQDGAAWRGLASGLLAHIAMLRGTMTVDSYLGRVSTNDVRVPPPPPALVKEFDAAISRAVELGRAQVAARSNDAQARYQYGAAVGIRASYLAAVDGSVLSAFRAAREAFDAHERVLRIDPSRADAGLVVGTYRYLVSALSLPMRLIAYAAGFGGGRERGLTFVEDAAAYPGDNQSDARIALVLLYNRERRYDAALAQLDALRSKYSRNRLFWLETGSTLTRAGRAAEAEQMLSEGMRMLEHDQRPRMLGEDALWFYRRGLARSMLQRTREAQDDLERAVALKGRPWVEGRSHLELGRIALQAGDLTSAREHFQSASRLGDSDRDGASAAHARALLKSVPRAE